MAKNYTANFKKKTRASAGEEPSYLLEITHPQLAAPIRVTNDQADIQRHPSSGTLGQAQAGSGDTLTLAAGASAKAGDKLKLIAGAGSLQERIVSAFAGGVATVSQRWATNAFQWTGDYANAYWTKSAILNDNGDGWWNLNDDNAAGWELITRQINGVAADGETWVLSVKIKKDSAPQSILLRLIFNGVIGRNHGVGLDASTGTITHKDTATAGNVGVEDGVDHWRIWVRGVVADGNTNVNAQLYPAVGPLPVTSGYNSATTGACDFKDLQLEKASELGEYIEAPDGAAITLPNNTTNYELVPLEVYLSCAFRVQFPEDLVGVMPRVPVAIDNIGKLLTEWLDASDGGRGAEFRIMQVMRDTPDVIEQEYTMTLLNAHQGVLEISGTLGYENIMELPGLGATQTPELQPAIF